MRTSRSRVLAATREQVWDVLADPWHEPRWWPRVQRVEGVSKRGWTSVLISRRGATVRMDWVVEEAQRPQWRRWAQELAGTPFERVFTRNAVEAALERQPDGGTRVTLTCDQQVRGMARLLPFLVRRPMRRQLEAALDGLAEAVEP